MAEKKKQIKAKVLSNRRICENHYLLETESGFLAEKAVPGQFVNVLAGEGVTDPFLRIPLGVHRIKPSGIDLLYKVVGTGTQILSGKTPGETIDILGPLGNGFRVEESSAGGEREHLLIAGGHGAAPLFALAEEIFRTNKKVTVFLGASSKKCVLLAGEFREIGCEVKTATDDGSDGEKGYVTCLVKDHLKNKKRDEVGDIYACGPEPMLAGLAEILSGMYLRAQVSVDPYMACGTGICRGCAVKTTTGYKLACKDGPVFYSDEIVWGKGKGCSL